MEGIELFSFALQVQAILLLAFALARLLYLGSKRTDLKPFILFAAGAITLDVLGVPFGAWFTIGANLVWVMLALKMYALTSNRKVAVEASVREKLNLLNRVVYGIGSLALVMLILSLGFLVGTESAVSGMVVGDDESSMKLVPTVFFVAVVAFIALLTIAVFKREIIQ